MTEQEEDEKIPGMPKRGDYRQRAHCNPLSDRDIPYPLRPEEVDWTEFYPILSEPDCQIENHYPTILDIGCGYGGLSFALAPKYPNNLILAFEIRLTVTTYVNEKIKALRRVGKASNVAVQWGNTMRTLMRYLKPNTIEKIFILFPDPHFKKRKTKWRIISPQLMDEYAFILKEGALLYLVTDVKTYFDFAVPIIESHPLFERIADPSNDEDLQIAMTATEESKKVARNGGDKFSAVFKRIAAPKADQ
ncbi:tRNA (guanine-N(7)-)-methyltransferase [Histomonas meleagridis]|uniref:tRNA (guanine-N(7)-)-methyltransferase n=1 Tax=Histomonas meleagridis TaxID=135588 RepID=UPI00355A9AD6|nr:tRNA (guanine-N(7)-)-methyltransferase [Histomonas meleagridis]KAH0801931.1 tRNA (guanine-N(7)-)-methyltransferase [Histomonas meleagridis]